MKKILPSVLTILLIISSHGASLAQVKQANKEIPNRLIDYPGFAKIVSQSGKLRAQRRLTEAEFLKMMSEKDVVVLDARTDKRYAMLHIRGAVNLPFTEFTEQTLARIIPNKKSKVLIYCNNNFLGNQTAFASKGISASLNLSTFTSLMTYGYTNIYELGPLLDVRTTRLPFDGEHAALQQLLIASKDWRSRMESRDVLYKFVRKIDGPDSPLMVLQETTKRSEGASLRDQAEFGLFSEGGLLIEDANLPGKYVLAITHKDLRQYLHPEQTAVGQSNTKKNASAPSSTTFIALPDAP